MTSPGVAFGAITLGTLIKKLERMDPVTLISYDYWNMSPTNLRSYRGFYEDLALGVSQAQSPPTAAALLEHCKAMLNTQIEGYKGGSYFVGLDTGVWASEWGQASGVIITDVDPFGFLITKKVD